MMIHGISTLSPFSSDFSKAYCESESSSTAKLRERIDFSQDCESVKIDPRRCSLKRATSSDSLQVGKSLKSEHALLADLSGDIWTCRARQPDPKSNGFFYIFEIKKEFDFVTEDNLGIEKTRVEHHFNHQNQKNFPDLEPDPLFILALDPQINLETFRELILKNYESRLTPVEQWNVEDLWSYTAIKHHISRSYHQEFVFKEEINALGYEVLSEFNGKVGIYLKLPDGETLLARWQELRDRYPQLPLWTIISLEGVPNDLDLVKAFLTSDFILSTDKRFIHDHYIHILPILRLMLRAIEDPCASELNQKDSLYSKVRIPLVKQLFVAYHSLLSMKVRMKTHPVEKRFQRTLLKIEAALGTLTDIFSATDNPDIFLDLDLILTKSMWSHKKWEGYWKKRFPEGVNPEEVAEIWQEMKNSFLCAESETLGLRQSLA